MLSLFLVFLPILILLLFWSICFWCCWFLVLPDQVLQTSWALQSRTWPSILLMYAHCFTSCSKYSPYTCRSYHVFIKEVKDQHCESRMNIYYLLHVHCITTLIQRTENVFNFLNTFLIFMRKNLFIFLNKLCYFVTSPRASSCICCYKR